MRARTWMTVAAALAAVIAVTASGAAGAATDKPNNDPRTVKVTATGIVRGTPDVLELTMGVETRDRSAANALARNTTLANKVIETLKDAGVEGDDVQTSSLTVSPIYDEDSASLTAYSVSNIVTARLRDFDKAGEVIDAATKVAGDEIVVQGISFSFDDNTELVAKARSDAVKRARAQAEQLTEAADVNLGDLLSITEENAPFGPAVTFEARSLPTTDTSVPIEPGSQQLTVQVTLVYEIT